MRVLFLLLLLAGVVGYAGHTARKRYPTQTVKVPGNPRRYEIIRTADQCWGKDCYLSVVFLTKGADRAAWRAEADELEPWLVNQARTGKQKGAILLAVRPGFAKLFPPTKERYFVMGGVGERWKILKEGDGEATTGISDLGSSYSVGDTPEIVLGGEDAVRVRFGAEVERLLLADRYAALDSLAESLRNPDARWPNGTRKLRTFYNHGFDISLRHASEAEWQEHLRHLRQWKAASPASITAPVALSYALSSYAWEARGNQWGREVSDEGWRQMRERLAQSRTVLFQARRLPRVCPTWWMAAQKVALGEGWERGYYERVFREAVGKEPTFEGYYQLKAIHLLPRWHGKQGEWEAFADTVAHQLPAPIGDQMYARIVWSTQQYLKENVFEESQVSWERTKRGYESLVTTYPGSLELRSAFAFLAWQAADQPTAKRQFIELGTRIDPGVWEDRHQFIEARKWAFTE